MRLSTVKSKLIADLPIPLNPEITPEFLQGIDRGVINPRKKWDGNKQEYIEMYEKDYIKYYIDAKVCETKFEGLDNVLVVDIYHLDHVPDAMLQYRILITQNDFITYSFPIKRFRESTIEKLLSYVSFGWYAGYKSNTSRKMIDTEQARIIKTFLHSCSSDPIEAIIRVQQDIRKNQLETKYKKIKEQIDMELQVMPPPLSQKTLVNWAENHVFLENRYIVYQRVGKKIHGYCSYCHADVQLKTARHNEQYVCPHCKSKVILKASGKTDSECYIRKRLAVIQKCQDGLVVRLYHLSKHFNDKFSISELYIKEDVRSILHNGGVTTYYHDFFQSTNELRWCKTNHSQFNDLTSYIYTPNLRQVFKGTPYQYCALYEYGKAGRTIDVQKYLDRYLQHPQLEYLVKLRLYTLAQRLATYGYSADDLQGNTITEVLGVSKNLVPLLQELDVDLHELQMFREAEIRKKPLTRDNILFLRKHNISIQLGTFRKLIRNVPFTALLDYCYKIAVRKWEDAKKHKYTCGYGYSHGYGTPGNWLNTVIMDYRDYLSECRELGFDIKDKQIAFPHNFDTAHARASAQIKALSSPEEQGKIIKVAENYAKFNMEDVGLFISVAKTAADIIYEGKILSHCVGGYVSKVAEGHCVIFLLRKTDEPDVPYYTVELNPNNMRIVQYRGYRNNNAGNPVPQEIHDFIKEWQKHIKQVQVKQKIKVAAVAV